MKINKKKETSILFIGKEGDHFSMQAAAFIKDHFPSSRIIQSSKKQAFPEELFEWEGDLIISYLSQWIIPKRLLQNARVASLNFHPGPPAYPGIGCTNFAIYNRADEFGVTCHHMEPKVDTGDIVAVKYFPVFEADTVYSITQRCYSHILNLFYEIISDFMLTNGLPSSPEVWKRKPFLRKELNELCRLTPDMDIQEIEQRIKATTYLKPWAFMEVGEMIHKLSAEDVKAKTYLNFR